MRIKCPSCFAEFDLVAALDSDAGRELMLRLATMDASLSRPLVVYISLFRSASRALAWDRALRLVDEVLSLESDKPRLMQGLVKANESLREKQTGQGWKPLTNHNYLKRCLEGIQTVVESPSNAIAVLEPASRPRRQNSRTADAMLALQELKE